MNEKKNRIRLVCIGRKAYAKPKGDPFPLSYPTPTIWEKQDPIYSGTDVYHKMLDVVYKDPSLEYSKIKYGDPNCSYQDPRPPIMTCDFSSSTPKEQEEALTVINAVRYTNTDLFEKYDFRKTRRYGVQYAMYNEDWYILVDYRGEIQSECLNYDARAREEYEKAIEKVESVYPKEKRNPGYEYRKRY